MLWGYRCNRRALGANLHIPQLDPWIGNAHGTDNCHCEQGHEDLMLSTIMSSHFTVIV